MKIEGIPPRVWGIGGLVLLLLVLLSSLVGLRGHAPESDDTGAALRDPFHIAVRARPRREEKRLLADWAREVRSHGCRIIAADELLADHRVITMSKYLCGAIAAPRGVLAAAHFTTPSEAVLVTGTGSPLTYDRASFVATVRELASGKHAPVAATPARPPQIRSFSTGGMNVTLTHVNTLDCAKTTPRGPNSGAPVALYVKNASHEAIDVDELDEDAQRVRYATIPAALSLKIATTAGRPWIFSANGICLLTAVTRSESGSIAFVSE